MLHLQKVILKIIIVCIFFINISVAQVSLILLNSYTLTPNETDTIGAFDRIFYHSSRNKFYLIYAARQEGSKDPEGTLSNFAWREYDADMNFTGKKGSLTGFSNAGDFAMQMVDSNYYHLTFANSSSDYKLSKFDDDFNLLDNTIIKIDSCSSNIDQLMNYTNGRLIIGAMYDSVFCPPINPPDQNFKPYSQIFQYDLNLNPLTKPKLTSPSKVTWGSSMIYNDSAYYEVTMDHFNNMDLYAFRYDTNFNFIKSTLLSNDGQWSQGLLFDAGYYYVAHHTGDHNRGNVVLDIYDENWSQVFTINVTNYPILTSYGTSFNANRPFIQKVGDKIYISYDVASIDYPDTKKDWQANVKVYQINSSANIKEISSESQFTISPNPASDKINVIDNSNTIYQYEIMDLMGKYILNSKLNTIDISNLTKGVYFIKIISLNNNAFVYKKFIKGQF